MYLITGGCGFIGSHIAEEMVKNGEQVIIYDNLSSGKKENIAHLNNSVKFIKGDIRNKKKLEDLMKDVDYIFHEAALVSVVESIKNPLKNNDININGTLNILETARKNGVKKVVMASSAAVYGDDSGLPKKESMKLKPISPYAVSKTVLEYYGKLYNELYNLNTVSLRYFNVYGPRQDPGSPYSGVISIFTNEFKKKNPAVKIYGDGEQTRDFIYIKDVVAANMLAMEKRTMNGKVYNVATGKEHSLHNLLHIMEEHTSKEVNIRYEKTRKGDIKKSVADIQKIKEKEFVPEFNLKKGLKKYFNSLGII